MSQPHAGLDIPTLEEIRAVRKRIDPYIARTPVWRWGTPLLPDPEEVWLKLELFQQTGTFKPRGAVNSVLNLDEEARTRGVTAVSAGNHAIAVAYAAQLFSVGAKLVMPRTAPAFRVARAESYGAEVILVDNVHDAFAEVERIEQDEGRTFIHPYEDRTTILGQATLGLEIGEQLPDLEALVIPIGGGGLAAGVATAMGQMHPQIELIGVEPEGADTMARSFEAGSPQAIERVDTIADSLGAPSARPYSFSLCRQFIGDIVRISDREIVDSMNFLFHEMKLACEPACAATTAALRGPLRERLKGRRVGLIACGSNIDRETFCGQAGAAEGGMKDG